jgi:hypothetical protein
MSVNGMVLEMAPQRPQTRPGLMSQLGQTRKSVLVTAMSAFAPIATKLRTSREVRFVPQTDRVRGSDQSLLCDASAARRGRLGSYFLVRNRVYKCDDSGLV